MTTATTTRPEPTLVVGRYALYESIGGGGMATVHLGRMTGAAGFTRVVAIKRLLPAHAEPSEQRTLLVDEARVASRIRHPNVVTTLDVVEAEHELLLVMEYVHGLPLSTLSAAARPRIPVPIAVRIVLDMLAGLHAAHEARSERGTWLEIVHRDVSPQNVIVGSDGIARIVDFGIAKARGKVAMTADGQIKGKLGYMAPEQLRAHDVDRRTDLYACGIVLWELLAGRTFYERTTADVFSAVKDALGREVPAPGSTPALDAVVLRATARDPEARFATADDMAAALEAASPAAKPREVAAFLEEVGQARLEARGMLVSNLERWSVVLDAVAPTEAMPVALTVPMAVRTEVLPAPPPRSRRRLVLVLVVAVVAAVLVALGVLLAPLRRRGRRRR